MIKVTRINDTELVINSDLIEFVEATPDTMISLTTGKKIMVRESVDKVIDAVAKFKRLSSISDIHRNGETVSDGR